MIDLFHFLAGHWLGQAKFILVGLVGQGVG
jgi:hypothetical protein